MDKKTIKIKPRENPFDIDWQEIWLSRDLFYFLAWRDVKVRYKQTLLGILWIILQPLISMIIFTIVFGNFANIPSDNIPYPIFVFAGLLFWNFFSSSLTSSATSLVSNQNIIKKVYFPRIMSPVASILSHIVDLIPTLLIFAIMFVVYKIPISSSILLIIPLLVLVLLFSVSLGFILAPINARYRDVRYVLPYLIQLGLFATPVIYPARIFGGSSKIVRIINPVAEAIEVTRSSILAGGRFDVQTFLLSLSFTLLLLFVGFYYFRSKEDKFIDIL